MKLDVEKKYVIVFQDDIRWFLSGKTVIKALHRKDIFWGDIVRISKL